MALSNDDLIFERLFTSTKRMKLFNNEDLTQSKEQLWTGNLLQIFIIYTQIENSIAVFEHKNKLEKILEIFLIKLNDKDYFHQLLDEIAYFIKKRQDRDRICCALSYLYDFHHKIDLGEKISSDRYEKIKDFIIKYNEKNIEIQEGSLKKLKDVHKEPYNYENHYQIMLNEQNVLQTMINEIEKNIETNSDEYFTHRYYLEHFITPKVNTNIAFIGSKAIDAGGLSKQIYTSVSREIIKLEDSGADESKEEDDVIDLESKEASFFILRLVYYILN